MNVSTVTDRSSGESASQPDLLDDKRLFHASPAPAPAPKESAVGGDSFLNKGNRQEIYIPLSGFVWLYPEEVAVMDHPAFQRLSRIYQLGQTYLVYRGATHKRFEHSLGTVHVIQRMIDALQNTHDKALHQKLPTAAMLTVSEQRFVRLGALLHDIGHLPAGHTIEDELCLAGKHDHDERLDGIFVGKFDPTDYDGPTLEALIDSSYKSLVPVSLNVPASELVRLLIRKPPADADADQHSAAAQALKESPDIRMNICRDMIGNTICADILDYIYRDWYHIGKPRPFDERILQYLELRGSTKNLAGKPEPSPADKIVVSLGRRPKIRTDAVSSILELLESRYQLAESVLFHRTKLCAAAMLDRALYELWGADESGKDGALEATLLSLTDEQLISTCHQLAESELKKAKASETKRQRYEVATKLLRALDRRQLFTSLCTFSFDDLPPEIHGRIQECYGKTSEGSNFAPTNRNKALRMLESDFLLSAGSLAMYCPTAGMNAKIAQVQIAVGDQIEKFCDYETKFGAKELSGGHLSAQLERFRRLWRVHFFISRKEKIRLEGIDTGLITALRSAAQQLVLKDLSSHETDELEVVRTLARQLSVIPGYQGAANLCTKDEIKSIAAKSDQSRAAGIYPSGMLSLSSAFRQTNK